MTTHPHKITPGEAIPFPCEMFPNYKGGWTAFDAWMVEGMTPFQRGWTHWRPLPTTTHTGREDTTWRETARGISEAIQREFHVRTLGNNSPLNPQRPRNYALYPEMPGERLEAIILNGLARHATAPSVPPGTTGEPDEVDAWHDLAVKVSRAVKNANERNEHPDDTANGLIEDFRKFMRSTPPTAPGEQWAELRGHLRDLHRTYQNLYSILKDPTLKLSGDTVINGRRVGEMVSDMATVIHNAEACVDRLSTPPATPSEPTDGERLDLLQQYLDGSGYAIQLKSGNFEDGARQRRIVLTVGIGSGPWQKVFTPPQGHTTLRHLLDHVRRVERRAAMEANK